jgi:hypothetical protein
LALAAAGLAFLLWLGLPAAASSAASVRLTVEKSGPWASATITSSPGGIVCGNTCRVDFPENNPVVLTVGTLPAGSRFDRWGGACAPAGTTPTCTVIMNEPQLVWARFSDDQDDSDDGVLIVTKTGNGSGTVRSNPAGTIDCGPICVGPAADESSVTLTATPDAGSRFVRWEGACSTSDNVCAVEGAWKVVRAIFELKPNLLFINKRGDGRGTVSSNPEGIDCGFDCVVGFGWATEVTLTATARPGSAFAGWGGACGSIVGKACRVTMIATRWVEAKFSSRATPPAGPALGPLKAAPKSRLAKPGRSAVFKVKVKNTGGSVAKAVRICVKAPGRLVRVKKCVKVGSLAAGKTAKATFKAKVSKKVKHGKKVKLTFTATGKGLAKRTARATLRVKQVARKNG